MPRPRRDDEPGCLFHVMNRGLSRRSVFEDEDDVRLFLSLLARAVHRDLVHLVAYTVLTNHFHLLVRSVDLTLSSAMHDILGTYVQYFNRTRTRDGPLFKGRFTSVPIRSDRQFFYTVRYIDANPVDAGIVANAEDYPHGSLRAHLGLVSRPRWLDAVTIDRNMAGALQRGMPRAEAYQKMFPPIPSDYRSFVEARLRSSRRVPSVDPLDLDDAGLVAWMQAHATRADGTRVGHPHVAASCVVAAVRDGRDRNPGRVDWDVLLVGLLRQLAGLRLNDACTHVSRSVATVSRMDRQHKRAVVEDPTYAAVALATIRAAGA